MAVMAVLIGLNIVFDSFMPKLFVFLSGSAVMLFLAGVRAALQRLAAVSEIETQLLKELQYCEQAALLGK